MSRRHACDFVVITGGEPMLQPLRILFETAPRQLKYQIETAGTTWPDGGLISGPNGPAWAMEHLSIVCSPKTPMVIGPLRGQSGFDVYWKYVVRANDPVDPNDGLPDHSTQIENKLSKLFRPSPLDKDRIFIAPCDEGADLTRSKRNMYYARDLALRHGYRLSLQQHKILGLE